MTRKWFTGWKERTGVEVKRLFANFYTININAQRNVGLVRRVSGAPNGVTKPRWEAHFSVDGFEHDYIGKSERLIDAVVMVHEAFMKVARTNLARFIRENKGDSHETIDKGTS